MGQINSIAIRLFARDKSALPATVELITKSFVDSNYVLHHITVDYPINNDEEIEVIGWGSKG